MATKANVSLVNSLIKAYFVKNGTTLSVGNRVKFGTGDGEVDLGGAGDDTTFGTVVGLQSAPGLSNVAQNAPTSVTAAASNTVTVDVALDSNQILPAIVGTGGSTRGLKQVVVATGITDAPVLGDGAVSHACCGIAMQTGVAGDLIGIMPLNFRFVAAT